jgi:hypothetical protein
VAGYGGAQAVARLADELNRKGQNGIIVSDPTSSAYKTERRFIWKTSKLIVGKAWLEKKYHLEIDREPYFVHFNMKQTIYCR